MTTQLWHVRLSEAARLSWLRSMACLGCGDPWRSADEEEFDVTASQRRWYHTRCAATDTGRWAIQHESAVLSGLQPTLMPT